MEENNEWRQNSGGNTVSSHYLGSLLRLYPFNESDLAHVLLMLLLEPGDVLAASWVTVILCRLVLDTLLRGVSVHCSSYNCVDSSLLCDLLLHKPNIDP